MEMSEILKKQEILKKGLLQILFDKSKPITPRELYDSSLQIHGYKVTRINGIVSDIDVLGISITVSRLIKDGFFEVKEPDTYEGNMWSHQYICITEQGKSYYNQIK